MDFSVLLKQKHVFDIIETKETIYIIVTKKNKLPVILSEKQIKQIELNSLYAYDNLYDVLTGVSAKYGMLTKKHKLEKKLLVKLNLNNCTTSQKQQLAHIIYGTKTRKSWLENIKGERAGKGAIIIPEQAINELQEIMQKHGAESTEIKTILVRGDYE